MADSNHRWFHLAFSLRSLLAVVTLSCLGLGTWVLLTTWIWPAQEVVRSRQGFAAYLVGKGGTVTYTDHSGQGESRARLPWIRRALGDRPVETIGIGSKTWRIDEIWEQTESLFPEVRQISVAPVDPDDPELANLFGGAANLEIIRRPDRVEARRIAVPERTDRHKLESYTTISPLVPLSPELASQLSRGVSYCWNSTLMCLPSPGVQVTFNRGDHCVEVLFCFECDLLLLFRDGQYFNTVVFRDQHNEFAAVMKKLFPDDPVIQGLKVKPSRVLHLRPKPDSQS